MGAERPSNNAAAATSHIAHGSLQPAFALAAALALTVELGLGALECCSVRDLSPNEWRGLAPSKLIALQATRYYSCPS